jgi:dTDP-4-dehydrorhamnose reductase
VNVIGTRNVAKNTPRILYVSTEYVFDGTKGNYTEQDYPNPLQFYGLTKLLGEYESRNCPHSVVARLLFKPVPYKHAVVPVGMMTSGGYVNDMAKELVIAIKRFERLPPTINIGIKRRGLKDLALETREVGDIDINSLPIKVPLDASLDLSLWKICKD